MERDFDGSAGPEWTVKLMKKMKELVIYFEINLNGKLI